MRWTLLQIVASLALFGYQPDPQWAVMDRIFAASLLAFHLIWSARHKFSELKTPASLYFSFLLGFSGLMCLCDGPLIALGLLWPALLLRLEDRPAEQRAWLALLQFCMALFSIFLAHYRYLSLTLAAASLVEAVDSKVARWLNLAALTLGLGRYWKHCCFHPIRLSRNWPASRTKWFSACSC